MDSVLQYPNLPVEILREILSRLPVRTLVRFRCLSSSWRALIEDPDFARFHLTRFKNNINESRVFIVQGPFHRAECLVICSESFRTIARPIIQTPSGAIQDWTVVGSIDGLFMLRQTSPSSKLTLWNPSIKRFLILPPSPDIPTGMKYNDFGLGFDPLSKDYKYAIFVRGFQFVAVYTLSTHSWRTIEFQGEASSRQYCRIPYTHKTLCFMGVLYVLAENEDANASKLVSFDLSAERFASQPSPVDDDLKSIYYDQVLTLADSGSSLAVFNFSEIKGSMWVLENIGAADIGPCYWTQRYSFPTTTIHEVDYLLWDSIFLYLTKNDEILLNKNTEVTSYNLVSQEEEILLENQFYMGTAWPYMESLIWF